MKLAEECNRGPSDTNSNYHGPTQLRRIAPTRSGLAIELPIRYQLEPWRITSAVRLDTGVRSRVSSCRP